MISLIKKHCIGFLNYTFNRDTKSNVAFYGTVFVTVASLISNFFAYLFQLIMGKALSVEEYGVFIALFSLLIFITTPINIFNTAVVKIVSEVKHIDYPKKISEFFYSLLSLNAILALITFSVLYFFRSFFLSYLNINNEPVFVLFLIFASLMVFASLNRPFLQALQRFKAYSLASIFNGLVKLGVAGIILYFGLDLLNAFNFLSLHVFISFLFTFILLQKNVFFNLSKIKSEHIYKVLEFTALSTFSLLGLTLLLNNDVLLVKHFFSATEAGFYSSATVIGRIIFYGVGPIGLVFFPIVAEKYSKKQDYFKFIFYGTALVLLVSSIGALIMSLFPDFIVGLLFGEKYAPSAQYLPLYSVFMVVYAAALTLGRLLVSISALKVTSVSIIFTVAHYLLVQFLFHNSITQILYASIITSTSLLIIFLVYLFKLYVGSKKVVT